DGAEHAAPALAEPGSAVRPVGPVGAVCTVGAAEVAAGPVADGPGLGGRRSGLLEAGAGGGSGQRHDHQGGDGDRQADPEALGRTRAGPQLAVVGGRSRGGGGAGGGGRGEAGRRASGQSPLERSGGKRGGAYYSWRRASIGRREAAR